MYISMHILYVCLITCAHIDSHSVLLFSYNGSTKIYNSVLNLFIGLVTVMIKTNILTLYIICSVRSGPNSIHTLPSV